MSIFQRFRFRNASLTALITLLHAGPALAGGIDVPTPAEPVLLDPVPQRAFPSVFGVNSAFPPVGGTSYVAYTHVTPREGIAGSDDDGEISVGYVYGNPINAVSVAIQANITGLDPFGDSGNFDISIARAMVTTDQSLTFIGASAGGLGAFGSAKADDESYSVYVSHLADFNLGATTLPVQLTLGYGNQIERASNGSGLIDEGVFYGLGVGITPNLSLSVSGTATQVNLGGTVTLDALSGLSLSGGIYDITDATDRQQFSLTAAFSF